MRMILGQLTRQVALVGCILMLGMGSAAALTFKKGEVLGADGQMYFGASPDVRLNLIRRAEETGDKSGVIGTSIFVVAGENITFVPIANIAGQREDKMVETIGNAVVANITGIQNLTLSTVTAAQVLAETKNIPVGRALIEQAFNDAVEAVQNADTDPLTAAESQELLNELLGANLVNADQSPVTDEQIVALLEDGDFDTLDGLIDFKLDQEVLASAQEVDDALADLGDIAGAADDFNALTEAAWQGISADDLNEAIEQANDYAASERATVAAQLAADPAFAATAEGQALAAEYGL